MAMHSVILGFARGSAGKESPCNAGELQGKATHSSILARRIPWSSSVMSTSAIPWTVAHQAPPSMEFSRQEWRSGLPFPSPGDLCDLGIEPRSPTFQADTLISEPPGKSNRLWFHGLYSHVLKELDTTEWLSPVCFPGKFCGQRSLAG